MSRPSRGFVRLLTEQFGAVGYNAARSGLIAFTLGLVLTFMGIHVSMRLFRARGWFKSSLKVGNLHIHHMVIGIIVMVLSALVMEAMGPPRGVPGVIVAFAFGAGVALTLDDFGLILHL